jgi:4-hydroxybenzoate polyprenyltransferase
VTAVVLPRLEEFLRLYQTGFVAVWPLLGWACVIGWSWKPAAALLVISCSFNIFGGVLNDVVDVEADRKNPERVDWWLVSGAVTRTQALIVVALQIPVVIVAHLAAGFPPSALSWLVGSLLGQAAYDAFGKRCPMPPLAEAGEAAAAACLVLYGAASAGGELGPLVWMTAGAGAAFILLVNAFHGGLRDIADDIGSGVRTTPIWLGCRGIEAGAVHISAAMSAYAGCWLAILLALSLLIAEAEGAAAVIPAGTGAVANVALFAALHQMRKPAWDIVLRLHVGLLMVPLMLAFGPRLGAPRSLLLLLVYITPMIPTAWRLATAGVRSELDRYPFGAARRPSCEAANAVAVIAAGENLPPSTP